jgi:hypothetical protein
VPIPPSEGHAMVADPPSRACLRVRVAGCVTGLVRLDPDTALDVDELLGAILAFGADEDIACVIATSPRPLTNSTDDAWSRHGSIFARHGRPVVGTPGGSSAERGRHLGMAELFRNRWRWLTPAMVHARLTDRSPRIAQALASVANFWGATGSTPGAADLVGRAAAATRSLGLRTSATPPSRRTQTSK